MKPRFGDERLWDCPRTVRVDAHGWATDGDMEGVTSVTERVITRFVDVDGFQRAVESLGEAGNE